MGVLKRTYRGRMNRDDSKYFVPKDDYTGARNISKNAAIENNDVSVSSTRGNVLVPYTKPAGTNITIGAKADLYRKRIIDFNYNSNGYHFIRIFDGQTRSFTKLLENKTDTGGVDILRFTSDVKILSVDIIHRDTAEGDLLFWAAPNNPPRKLNIDRILSGSYGVIHEDFICAAKKPPLHSPIVTFGSDTTRSTNNLRKKLYQLKYRWVYDDFEKSTWSPISDTPIPVDILGNDNDLNPSTNNHISAIIKTGNKDVLKIEVAARVSNGSTWNDFQLVDVLVKSELSITDNGEYNYKFYNDGLYPFIDIIESDLLFDWIPRYANAQSLVNGNVIVYGGIVEGYNSIPVSSLDVSMTVANRKNIANDGGPASISYSIFVPGTMENRYRFTINGRVPTGTRYRVVITLTDGSIVTLFDYTSTSGNTTTNVASGCYATVPLLYQFDYFASNYFDVRLPAGTVIVSVSVVEGVSTSEMSATLIWNWYSKYRFGLVYFDGEGRTDGVITNTDIANSDTDFEINTGGFSITGGVPETPVISATINHEPPEWAVAYKWVRTENLTYQKFLYHVTNDFQSDSDYYYFGLQNISFFYDLNNKFVYPSLSVAEGDRIKVIVNAPSGAYGSNLYTQDFEIIGTVDRQMTGGTSTDQGVYVKVKKPVTSPSPAFGPNMFVMIYTPKSSATNEKENVYFEFGPTYDIYSLSGNRYHRGQIADQTASNPAEFEWTGGDIYYHNRVIYTNCVSSGTKHEFILPDINYNEFYKSSVNGNGRPQVVDPNAKEQYYPVTVRFSQEYIQNSNINGTNRFYFDNQDTYNRSFGDIMRLMERDKQLRVYQKFKVGMVPVYQQIIKDAANNDILSQSDKLLNNIQYYTGDFGIGDAPESLASAEFADYFCDTYRGQVCRLARDGITPLAMTYKMNGWSQDQITDRGSDYKIYGVYDIQFSRYIIALEAAGAKPAETLSFYEPENAFESFHDFKPEMMVCLGTLLCSYKNGDLWTHDSDVYCNFYGTQYKPEISAVYNDGFDFKMTYMAARFVSATLWECPYITTSLGQSSNLLIGDFRKKEDGYYAPLLRDELSPGGINRGDALKGNWIEMTFRAVDGSVFNSIIMTGITYKESNKNT